MIDYLEELFERELTSKRLDFARLPGYADRQRRLAACHAQIHAALGLAFLDQLNDLEGENAYCERLACFRCGFRLALGLAWAAGG